MLFILFGTAGAATVLAAIALSNYADELSEKTSLGGLLVGTVLLASATSLPEVTTSISAVFLENPDIAVGNMLGSNMFNLFIIASFDLWYRKLRLYQSVSSEHVFTAGLGFFLSLMTLFALVWHPHYVVYGVGLDSLCIAFVCILGMFIISKAFQAPTLEQDMAANNSSTSSDQTPFSLKKTITGFFIMALLITGAGTMLSFVGDEIARVTGIGSSFVGSFFLAATTSMPEAIAVLVALRLKNVNLALGSILGSNIFNMLILTSSDAVYRKGPILSNVSSVHQVSALSVCVLSLILMLALKMKKGSSVKYLVPSLLIIVVYVYSSYRIFQG
ncbi:sodium:calcium antiporter [Domibacillus robiginosus]|uniref:sodium:calcium antiporter n=1 Tax=Domibacillus robiginosus TaxID=1071054 RepID=UPI00067D3111|nr:sodium:calcium antiporter [Domibacillus robiginosus]